MPDINVWPKPLLRIIAPNVNPPPNKNSISHWMEFMISSHVKTPEIKIRIIANIATTELYPSEIPNKGARNPWSPHYTAVSRKIGIIALFNFPPGSIFSCSGATCMVRSGRK